LAGYVYSQILFVQHILRQIAAEYRSQTVWFFQATIVCHEINQLLLVSNICVCSMELNAGCLVTVAVWHSIIHNHESCIWMHYDSTSRLLAHALCQIRRGSHIPTVFPFSLLRNLACTFCQQQLNTPTLNPFRIIKVFLTQRGLESHQNLCNHCLPVQGFISLLFQMILS
jgi:hypothetical protein